MTSRIALTVAASLALSACGPDGDALPATNGAAAAQPAPDSPEGGDRVLLWGDTHVHTRNSTDAYMSGKGSADIDTAYRFARGLPVIQPRTQAKIRIDRPLDFLVVADHADMLSVSRRAMEGDAQVLATASGQWIRKTFAQEGGAALVGKLLYPLGREVDLLGELDTPPIRQSGWDYQVDAAERHNRPGKFTALIGWEWSSTPGGINLHRVVFTNADGERAKQFLPFNQYTTTRPEDLWNFLEETRDRTGADFVSIPHNSNLSNGQMFDLVDSDGNAFSAAYARRRAQWEPVMEVAQYKGMSETHPALSPRDEFAGFEIRNVLLGGGPADPTAGSYARSALKRGLEEEARIGVNPYRFGMIGSTDSHTGFTSVDPGEFYGKFAEDLFPEERRDGKAEGFSAAWDMSSAGLAAAWADGNTRQSIFEAFRRREVYATSGPRMQLRLFAGYGFAPGDEARRDFAAHGYRSGVPMGGVLAPAGDGKAPQFAIRAVKDPDGANLDRVQVIKGWLGSDEVAREKIYDVAWAGGRVPGADGSLPPVGNSVDIATGRYSNAIGAAELAALWSDPEFDPAQAAFYYVRVIQIPTPNHRLFDMFALGMDPRASDRPITIQERAWSSPVWYRP